VTVGKKCMSAEKLVADLQTDFVLDLHGELECYLGCKIVQDLQKGTVTINHEKHAYLSFRTFRLLKLTTLI
jgi:hypothetical protein